MGISWHLFFSSTRWLWSLHLSMPIKETCLKLINGVPLAQAQTTNGDESTTFSSVPDLVKKLRAKDNYNRLILCHESDLEPSAEPNIRNILVNQFKFYFMHRIQENFHSFIQKYTQMKTSFRNYRPTNILLMF